MHDIIFDRLRSAIRDANINGDANFGFGQQTIEAVGTSVKQLRVQYSDGNEYLRLDLLLKSFAAIGRVLSFEYRGRGRNESPRLVAEVDVQNEVYQIVYFLPSESAENG